MIRQRHSTLTQTSRVHAKETEKLENEKINAQTGECLTHRHAHMHTHEVGSSTKLMRKHKKNTKKWSENIDTIAAYVELLKIKSNKFYAFLDGSFRKHFFYFSLR